MSKKNSNVILKKAFKESLNLREVYLDFKKRINKFKNNIFIVAVSGGPDSLALAALSKFYCSEYKSKFLYVLINHNIRKNSLSEAKKVKSLLKKNGINLIILSNKEKIKKNIQKKARDIRYELLSKFCIRKKISYILTAHNLEDQVETFFLRLSRGSGLTGLSAMKVITKISNKISLCRPLLNVKKKNLVEISKISFGKFFKDPSNKNEKYLRTKIRNLKKPLKQSGISYDQVIKSINNLATSKATLDQYVSKTFKDLIKKSGGKLRIDLSKFKKLNDDIQISVINRAIKLTKKNYYNPRAKKAHHLAKNLESKKFTKSTLGGCTFYKEKDQIWVKTE